MNKTQKGFALLEGLLVVLILTIIGFGGYYVWHTQKQTDKTSADTVKASSSNPATSTSSKNYLTIKEEGVKFLLSDKIKDAYYFMNDNGYIYFSVHQFDNLRGAEGCRAQKTDTGSLGLVALITAKLGQDNGTPGGGTWTQADLDASGLTKVGDTYYGFQRGNGPCYDLDSPPAVNFEQTISDLIGAFHDQSSTFTKS